jgi:hypothetical protein
MAQGVGSNKSTKLGQDTFGGHFFGAVDYSGSTSYVLGGDSIDPHAFGFPNSIITLIGSVDQTNTYYAIGRPIQNGITPWQLVWYVKGTGAEVAANTNLSGFTVRLTAIGV